ncbi:MAG TPA: TauD/TfdA family dioxygenase [Acidimicrobiales bacterium]
MAPATIDLRVERQAGAIGALIYDVDLKAALDDDASADALVAALRSALLEHLVICIRGQSALTPDEQLAFARRWGEVSVHPYVPSIEGHPGIMRISQATPVTTTWHADTTHVAAPPAMTMLLARVVPPAGGDTMFANQYAAFEGLSDGLKATLRTLRAVHYGTELAKDAGVAQETVTNSHPVVRTHPETGRECLFVNANYVRHFEGWTEAESAPLLQFLYAQASRPELTWRHRWQLGDLLIWDNRCTQHAVVGDIGGAERELHRITIAGDVPR